MSSSSSFLIGVFADRFGQGPAAATRKAPDDPTNKAKRGGARARPKRGRCFHESCLVSADRMACRIVWETSTLVRKLAATWSSCVLTQAVTLKRVLGRPTLAGCCPQLPLRGLNARNCKDRAYSSHSDHTLPVPAETADIEKQLAAKGDKARKT